MEIDSRAVKYQNILHNTLYRLTSGKILVDCISLHLYNMEIIPTYRSLVALYQYWSSAYECTRFSIWVRTFAGLKVGKWWRAAPCQPGSHPPSILQSAIHCLITNSFHNQVLGVYKLWVALPSQAKDFWQYRDIYIVMPRITAEGFARWYFFARQISEKNSSTTWPTSIQPGTSLSV